MEADVEQKLREKYTLIDKTDPAAIAAAQQVINYLRQNKVVLMLHMLKGFFLQFHLGTFCNFANTNTKLFFFLFFNNLIFIHL